MCVSLLFSVEREERIAKEQAEEELRRKQEEEQSQRLAAQAAKQRQREQEIEEKMSQGGQPSGAKPGGWRAREAAKHNSWMKKP